MPPLDTLDSASLDALRALIEDVDRATHEIARLSHEDDRGSGERTARLSSLGAWESNRARLLERIEAIVGATYRTSSGAPDLERLRAIVEAR